MALLSILKKSKAHELPADEADIDLGQSYVELQQAKPARLPIGKDVFRLFIGLPVLLHVRRAVDQILKGLRDIGVPGGIAHAFNGSRQQADLLLALGFKLFF